MVFPRPLQVDAPGQQGGAVGAAVDTQAFIHGRMTTFLKANDCDCIDVFACFRSSVE